MRITIIDRHTLFAESLARSLEQHGYVVTAVKIDESRTSLASILAVGLRSAGRLVLLEQHMGAVGDGIRLIAPLTSSGAAVVLLTESTDPCQWGEALRQGARDVLHKSCSLGQVIATARRVRDGLPLMPPGQRASLVAVAVREYDEVRAIRTRLGRLTAVEREILGALMQGHAVRQIAEKRMVEEATVRSQVKSMLGKLEMRSQVAAVSAAHRVAWCAPQA